MSFDALLGVPNTTELMVKEIRALGFNPDEGDCVEVWNQQHARKPGFAFGDGPWVATARVERVASDGT